MTDTPPEGAEPGKFQFIRNGQGLGESLDWSEGPDIVRKALGDALNARNVAFLLGAGCSSLEVLGVEKGIPTMAPLAATFCEIALEARANGQDEAKAAEGGSGDDAGLKGKGDDADPKGKGQEHDCASQAPAWALTAEELTYLETPGIDLKEAQYARNLERLMEALYSLRFLVSRSNKPTHQERRPLIDGIITKVKSFLLESCSSGAFAVGDDSVLKLYESFYRKLVLRDRSLPRPWVFTTNYDLFNETAMDRLGLPYANGFSGVIERRFNSATFRYALAEQLDVSSRKWSAVDGFVYLCKLHGSISWTQDDHGLFPIRERWPMDEPGKVMIFPTPAKQNASLTSPYADLFREFQSRVVREQSVLVTVGYAFGDEHLNNIIYQALTIPTFRLIVFAAPDAAGETAKLRALNDPRIWIIGGAGPGDCGPAHYFANVIEHFMPELPSERIDDAVRRVLEASQSAPRAGGIENQ